MLAKAALATPIVTLRPVTRLDEALIERWIRQPDIQRWWGDRDSAFAEVRQAMTSPSAICRIIDVAGEAVGYAHAIDAAVWGDALPDGLPAGSWDIDLFIAVPGMRGRGVGETALQALTDEVFSTTLAVAVSVFVSVKSEAAVRAYEKAGYHWVRIVEDPIFGPMWLMLCERPRQSRSRTRR